MKTKTIEIHGCDFPTAHEAIQNCDASGWDCAIRIGGKNICMEEEEADRLETAGVEFAYLCDH
jgi:hypothetical protein